MTPTLREEAVTKAYVKALAARLGYVASEQDFDVDGVDIQLRDGGDMLPTLDIQLKGTVNLPADDDGVIKYPLKQRNYDLLIGNTIVPRILVLCGLERCSEEWIVCGDESLLIKQKAYWMSLNGFPQTSNTTSTTISIPSSQRFNEISLPLIMNRIRKRQVL
ncbi:DUF4365 domain-containing protein [Jannaschia pohangensis]|uniref:DUF4365 domain-containing protein n=1 Tax=Jannaschia pohangensis TaxID=390807 RepID=UPI001587514C|nr:DUF4365 domain-containing protein [Jannaschia pohangensis]